MLDFRFNCTLDCTSKFEFFNGDGSLTLPLLGLIQISLFSSKRKEKARRIMEQKKYKNKL